MLFLLLDRMGWWSAYLPPALGTEGWLRQVMWFNLFALVMRVVQRCYFVGQLYGWEHSLLAVPRMVVGNFVNAMAAARAWRLFLGHVFLGQRLVWNKTLHDFPAAEQLAGQRQRLGELLTTWKAIDATQLQAALSDQESGTVPLGRILLRKGWLDEETLAEALAFQSALPRVQLGAAMVHAGAGQLPLDSAIRWRVLALPESTTDLLYLAVAAPLPEQALAELRQQDGRKIRQAIVRESDIVHGLRQLRGVPEVAGEPETPLLGDVLIEHGLVTRERFERALESYRSDQDGLIGAYLVRSGVLTQAALDKALALRQAPHTPKEVQP
jgi:adsorption protein B